MMQSGTNWLEILGFIIKNLSNVHASPASTFSTLPKNRNKKSFLRKKKKTKSWKILWRKDGKRWREERKSPWERKLCNVEKGKFFNDSSSFLKDNWWCSCCDIGVLCHVLCFHQSASNWWFVRVKARKIADLITSSHLEYAIKWS